MLRCTLRCHRHPTMSSAMTRSKWVTRLAHSYDKQYRKRHIREQNKKETRRINTSLSLSLPTTLLNSKSIIFLIWKVFGSSQFSNRQLSLSEIYLYTIPNQESERESLKFRVGRAIYSCHVPHWVTGLNASFSFARENTRKCVKTHRRFGVTFL